MNSEAATLRIVGPARLPGQRATPGKQAFLVGITGDGYVPVMENFFPAEKGLSTGLRRSVLGLPSLLLDGSDMRASAPAQLGRQFGYEVDELIPLEPSLTPRFFLAPLLRNAGGGRRTTYPENLYEVPLRGIPEWLRQRKQAGAIESPSLARGLRLAQEAFPRWAHAHLCRAIREVEDRAGSSRASI